MCQGCGMSSSQEQAMRAELNTTIHPIYAIEQWRVNLLKSQAKYVGEEILKGIKEHKKLCLGRKITTIPVSLSRAYSPEAIDDYMINEMPGYNYDLIGRELCLEWTGAGLMMEA